MLNRSTVLALCAGAVASSSALAQVQQIDLDIGGAQVIQRAGNPINEQRTYDLAAELGLPSGTPVVIRGLGWDTTLTTFGTSWASTAYVNFRRSTGGEAGLRVRPAGPTFHGVTSERFESEVVNLNDVYYLHPTIEGTGDVYLPDGVLRLEFFDLFNSVTDGVDAVFESPSTLTVEAEGTNASFSDLPSLSVGVLTRDGSAAGDTTGADNNLDLGGLRLPGGRYNGGDHVYTLQWNGGIVELVLDVASGDHGLAVFNASQSLIDLRETEGDERLVLSLGAGNYYLVVDSRAGDEGAYTIAANTYVAPTLASQTLGTFGPNEPLQGDNTGAQDDIDFIVLSYPGSVGYWYGGDDVWTLEWPGGHLHLTATSETGDPDIGVFDMNQAQVAAGGAIGDDQAWSINLPAGSYYVTVDAYTTDDEGPYTLLATPVEFLLTGEVTEESPRYHHPNESGTGLDQWGTNAPYAALPFTVDADGAYDITTIFEGYDGFLVLYAGSFNPETPLENFVTADDRYTDNYVDARVSANLVAGADYVLVVSGFSGTQFGEFGVLASGPGNVLFTEPCAADFDGSGAADVNDLLGFLGAFRTQGQGSDFDGSGSVDVNDLLGFLGAFRAGC